MPFKSKELTPERSSRHLFGAEMRRYREEAGWSLDELAGKLHRSKSTLSKVETADQMIPEDLPAQLDGLFGTGIQFERLYGPASKEIHPDWVRRALELEAEARLIQQYTGQVMPGLLQTEEYARALFEAGNPKAAPEQIEELVAARMGRQTLLLNADPEPNLTFVIDEGVFRRHLGGSQVMREQLTRLADLTFTPNCVLQVLPFAHGWHALMGGSLKLMTMEDGAQVAYEESSTSGTLYEDSATVAARLWQYDRLRLSALSPSESAVFIRSVMEELPHEQPPGPRPRPVGQVLVQRQWRRQLR